MRLLMFPGQGTQKPGMGAEIFNIYKSAKMVFDEVDDVINFKLSNLIFNGTPEDLLQTENSQVSIMATSIAYLKAYEEEHNVKLCNEEAIVAGHSLGEYTALCVAGALSLRDTVKLLWTRGNAMRECSNFKCGMAAVLGLALEQVQNIVSEVQIDLPPGLFVQVANDNCPGQVVVSGHKAAIDVVMEKARAAGARRSILLNVAGAFHSVLMQPAADKMACVLKNIKFNIPICPIIANYTAQPTSEGFQNLLVKQMTGCVRWRESLMKAVEIGVVEAIEIGPEAVLAGLARRTVPEITVKNINSVESVRA